MVNQPLYTVISGDIVASQQVSSKKYDALLYVLEQNLQKIAQHYGGRFSVFRGDGFQCVLPDSQLGFRAALQLRLGLISEQLDARLSLSVGKIENYRADVKTATGEALTLSGRALDNMQQERLCFSRTQEISDSFLLNIRFVDHLIGRLTTKQAQVLYYYYWLDNNEHAAIASELNTSRTNVTKLLNAAHYHLINGFLAVAEKELRHD